MMINLINDDCLNALKLMPDNSVDAVICVHLMACRSIVNKTLKTP